MRLLLALLLFLIFATPSQSAFHFTIGDADTVSLTDNAALTFPDGDWTLFCKLRLTSTSGWGSDGQVVDWGNGGSFRLRIDQDLGVPGAVELFISDGTDTIDVSSDPLQPYDLSTSWTTVLAERNGSNFNVEVNGSVVVTTAVGNVDAVDVAAPLHFGRASGGANPIDADIAECVKFDRVLTAGEKAGINQGTDISPGTCLNKTSMSWYVPMIRDYVERKVGIAVTNTGTTVVAHPRIIFCAD